MENQNPQYLIMQRNSKGVVAEIFVFSNGKTIMCWLGKYPSIVIYDSLDALKAVHDHHETHFLGADRPKLPERPIYRGESRWLENKQ